MRTLLLLSLLATVPALAEHPAQPRGSLVLTTGPTTVVDRDEIFQRLARIDRMLEKASRRLGGRDPGVSDLLRQAQGDLGSLRTSLGATGAVTLEPAPDLPPDRPPHGVPSGPRPIDPKALDGLVEALSREARAEDQLRIVVQAAPNNRFLVDQAQVLLARIRSDSHRLRAVQALRSQLLDPENGFRLFSLFSSSADKATLQGILQGAPNAELSPISDEQLQQLLTELTGRWTTNDRLQLLQERAPNHWFHAAQLRPLMEMFMGSSDRMRVATTLRPRVLDPQNHELLTSLFMSRSDQDALRRLFRP